MSSSTDTGATVAIKRHFINPPPKGAMPAGVPKEQALAEFGRRLQALLTEKGWNQSDLARHASGYMPSGKEFRRDNVSLYVRGMQMPGPVRLRAICRALNVKPEDLVPAGAVSSVDEKSPPLSMRAIGEGTVWLQINQAVPLDMAMKIVGMLGTGKKG